MCFLPSCAEVNALSTHVGEGAAAQGGLALPQLSLSRAPPEAWMSSQTVVQCSPGRSCVQM